MSVALFFHCPRCRPNSSRSDVCILQKNYQELGWERCRRLARKEVVTWACLLIADIVLWDADFSEFFFFCSCIHFHVGSVRKNSSKCVFSCVTEYTTYRVKVPCLQSLATVWSASHLMFRFSVQSPGRGLRNISIVITCALKWRPCISHNRL